MNSKAIKAKTIKSKTKTKSNGVLKNKIKSKKKFKVNKKTKNSKSRSNTKMNEYITTILNLDKSSRLPILPNNNFAPYHVCKRKAVLTYQVNASGNLYLEYVPSILANVANNSTVSPFIALNNPAYTDPNGNLNITAAGGMADLTAVNTLCLDGNVFHNATVTGFYLKLSATGVSTSNRAGFLTMCETVDDTALIINNSVGLSSGTLNQMYNNRPLKAQIQSDIKLEQDLATAYSNSFEYIWIPNYHMESAVTYDYDVIGQSAPSNFDSADFRKLGVFVTGANVSTVIRVEIVVMYQATPTQALLTTYPVQYGNDYENINEQLQKLSRLSRLRLRQTDTHLSGYIGGVVNNQNVVVKQN